MEANKPHNVSIGEGSAPDYSERSPQLSWLVQAVHRMCLGVRKTPPPSGPAGDVRREGGLDDTYKDMGFYCQNITTTALTDLADTSNM